MKAGGNVIVSFIGAKLPPWNVRSAVAIGCKVDSMRTWRKSTRMTRKSRAHRSAGVVMAIYFMHYNFVLLSVLITVQ
jgi:hypothetical protein